MEQSKAKRIEMLAAFPKGFEREFNYNHKTNYNAVVARFNALVSAGDIAGQGELLRQHGGRISLALKCKYQNLINSFD